MHADQVTLLVLPCPVHGHSVAANIDAPTLEIELSEIQHHPPMQHLYLALQCLHHIQDRVQGVLVLVRLPTA